MIKIFFPIVSPVLRRQKREVVKAQIKSTKFGFDFKKFWEETLPERNSEMK